MLRDAVLGSIMSWVAVQHGAWQQLSDTYCSTTCLFEEDDEGLGEARREHPAARISVTEAERCDKADKCRNGFVC